MNEKSKIIKIIQKEQLNEKDKDVIISVFSKYPPKELKLLLGNDFQSLFSRKDIPKSKQIINMSSKYKSPKKYYFIEKEILQEVKNYLSKKGLSSVRSISEKIGVDFGGALYHGSSINENSFLKLKRLLGKQGIFELFTNEEIPHKVIIGHRLQILLKKNGITAELVNIMLGDGNLSEDGKTIKLSFNGIDEPDYVKYVKKEILEKLFKNIEIREEWQNEYIPGSKGLTLIITNVAVHYALISMGLIPGNKVKNQVKAPIWNFEKNEFIIRSLRGLFDTDGSITIKKKGKSLRLSFSNSSKLLVKNFYDFCQLLNIKTSNITGPYKSINSESGSISLSWTVRINKKSEVRRFLEIVKPEKFKETFRRIYLGTILIYLDAPQKIRDSIEKQIRSDYPDKSNRKYSREFAFYLLNLCKKKWNKQYFTIKNINKAINNALNYDYSIYNKDLAKQLKFLYECLGSYKYVIEYLTDQNEKTIPSSNSIINHIKKYIEEELGLKYVEWLENYKRPEIKFNSSHNKIIRFPLDIREKICIFLYKLFIERGIKWDNKEIYKFLKSKLKKLELLKIEWLMEKQQYKEPLRKYLLSLIGLIKKIVILQINNEIINPNKLHKDPHLNLPFGIKVIDSILKSLSSESFINRKSKIQQVKDIFINNPKKSHTAAEIVSLTNFSLEYVCNSLLKLRKIGFIEEVDHLSNKKNYQLID